MSASAEGLQVPGASTAREVGGRTIPDRVLGFLGAVMIVAAVVALIAGGPTDTGSVPSAPPPPLELLEPAAGAVVSEPVTLRFSVDTGDALTWTPAGWGTGGYHLHAEVDGRELMPTREDIVREAGNIYQWTIPTVSTGDVTLRILWSDTRHRPVAESGSAPVRLRVQSGEANP